jgi:hypothetical protein
MSISLSSKSFDDFDSLSKLESNINFNKIILNNNLILEKDFINNGEMVIRGSIIFNGGKLINRGNIYLIEKEIIEYILPFDINGDYQYTGLEIQRDINDLNLLITGPSNSSVSWKNDFIFQLGRNSSFYFSNDGGLTPKSKIEAGDRLYWNESYSKLRLYKSWRIILQLL